MILDMNKSRLVLLLLLISGNLIATPLRANEALFRLLQERSCSGCKLADTDLVHADLRDADLSNSKLMRANLSQAMLDGANLSNADLSFTSLRGASLRGANLSGATIYGTDLRDCDLTGAQLDANALEESHWSGAKGITAHGQSHAALHNAGVSAAESGRWTQAEELFSQAIVKQSDSAESWVARGISREKLGKRQLALQDFNYASQLYASKGGRSQAAQLTAAAKSLEDKANEKIPGNGIGTTVLNGLMSTSKALLPLAMKLFVPAVGF